MLSSPKIGFQSSWRSAVLGYFHSGSADISQLSPALSLLLGLLKVTEHQGGGGRPPRGWPQENVFRINLKEKEMNQFVCVPLYWCWQHPEQQCLLLFSTASSPPKTKGYFLKKELLPEPVAWFSYISELTQKTKDHSMQEQDRLVENSLRIKGKQPANLKHYLWDWRETRECHYPFYLERQDSTEPMGENPLLWKQSERLIQCPGHSRGWQGQEWPQGATRQPASSECSAFWGSSSGTMAFEIQSLYRLGLISPVSG